MWGCAGNGSVRHVDGPIREQLPSSGSTPLSSATFDVNRLQGTGTKLSISRFSQ